MSYLFQSRQLHPRHCSLGMGLVGPDQQWTRETAGKQIAPREEPCPPNGTLRKLSEFAVPKTSVAGEVIDDPRSFKTGKIWEARHAGVSRHVEWCCIPTPFLPSRDLTQEEHDSWGERCGLMRYPSGTMYETFPGWTDANRYVGSKCERTNIFDEGYELICCPAPHRGPRVLSEMKFVQATPTVEQEASWEAQHQEVRLERERLIQEAAILPPTFVERYGFAMLLVVGTVGIGVTAAFFKRFSVAARKAEEAKTAVAAMQENPNDGHGLETIEVDDGFFEVYNTCPHTDQRDFLGVIDDSGFGGRRFKAMSRRESVSSHMHLDDAAKWLSREMYIDANEGERDVDIRVHDGLRKQRRRHRARSWCPGSARRATDQRRQ